jgi:hypothetical protein
MYRVAFYLIALRCARLGRSIDGLGFSTWISNGAKPGGITGFAKALANAPGLRLRLPS